MKRFILCLLALMMTTLSLAPALSEGLEALRQAVEAAACGGDASQLNSLLASLPEACSPGTVLSQSWEGADGATYTFVYYSGVSVSQPAPSGDMTSQELLTIMDQAEAQLRAQACDPAQIASRAARPTAAPAASAAARPAANPTVDPAVYWTAQPAAEPTAAPAVSVTPCPTVCPTACPASVHTARVNWGSRFPRFTARPVQAQAVTPAATKRPAAAPTSAPIVSTGDYTTFDSTMQEQKLLNLLNQDRARNGLPPLALDPELSNLARLKSSDMNANHYFAHESPTYGSAGQMLTAFNYSYQGVGENIAHHANVEKAEAAFMSSDGHRRNILGSQWDKVGIGVTYDENGNVYVTQLFAR